MEGRAKQRPCGPTVYSGSKDISIGKGSSTMSDKSESVGEQVGTTVAATISETERAAKFAVDEAARKADEAARAAESIAGAALHTELGSRLASQEERLVKWLDEHEANKQAIAAISASQATLAETLTRLSSNLEKLTPAPTPDPMVVVTPQEKQSDTTKTEASERKEAPTETKRTRLFL